VVDNNLAHRGKFKGTSHPSDIQGEEDHDLSLARAFMPLSAPKSRVEVEGFSKVDELRSCFFRALLVLIGDTSELRPLDQASFLPWSNLSDFKSRLVSQPS
jgi:hypothetical protein